MSLSKFAARRRGFTLIELLIVIVVIAILALIVIPKLMGASRKAKESTLRANLQLIRNAVEMYRADTGAYPQQLSYLTLSTTAHDALTTTVTKVPSGTYKGPYLDAQGGIAGLPINPFSTMTAAEDTTTGTPTADSTKGQWFYDKADGKVYSGVGGSTVDTPAIDYWAL